MTERGPEVRRALTAPAAERLRRTIRRTRLAIAAERAAACFWPAWALALASLGAVRLELLLLLPGSLRLAALLLAGTAFLLLLGRGLRRFRWPSRAEAVARIDDALPGRPVAALADRQALGREDPAARGIWAAHMRRVAALAAEARAARADLRLSARDPFALRLAALVLAAAALLFGRGTVEDQVVPALVPPASAGLQPGLVLEAWASPPAYTGRPTLYLTGTAPGTSHEVPEGTVITLRLYGEGEASLAETVTPAGDSRLATATPGLRSAEFVADRSGEVRLADGRAAPLGAWSFTVIPDDPPAVSLVEPPQRTASGAGRFVYRGQDDYGILAAWATVRLDPGRADRRHGLAPDPEPREPVEFDLPLPLSGPTRDFTEKEFVDLSLHPWAGLPVTVTLGARDAAGQETLSEPYEVVLPGRRFFDPLARAIVEQRRDLLWSLANADRVARLLKAVSHAPEGLFRSNKAYLVLRTAIRRLDYARDEGRVAEARESVSELLWRAALLVEDGDLGDALERLRRAQERLSQALESDATDEEIAELMDELRRAMQDYLQELMRQALERMDPNAPQDQAEADPNMSMQDLQDMLDRLQQLMQEGRRAEAQELLEQLRRMMENLQMTMRPGQNQPGQGQQMMEGLQDLMRQQEGLGDETFRELQRQMGEGDRPGQQPGPGTGELSRRQEALRRLLEQFRNGLPPGLDGTDPADPNNPGRNLRRSLEDAEREMGDARESLERGDPGSAVEDQADALESLREGMRALAEALRQGEQQDGTQDGPLARDRQGDPRDPLGRPIGPSGQIDSNDVRIPGTEAWKRSREIQEEIRRRAGEQDRPKLELDYLKRLLDRF